MPSANESELVLWGAGTPRTLRPIWVAEELGLDYALRPIGPRTGETRTPEYTQINPKQKVPTLEYGALRLTESLAICRHLLDVFGPGPFWRPSTAVERAREDEWCCFVFGEIDETSLYVMRRHRDLAAIYGEAPAAVDSSAEYARRQLRVAEQRLERAETLVGDGFGLADLLLVSCLDWAVAYGVEIEPALQTHRRRIAARPAYRRAMRRNYPEEMLAQAGLADLEG